MLLDQTELADRSERLDGARALLYIAQGQILENLGHLRGQMTFVSIFRMLVGVSVRLGVPGDVEEELRPSVQERGLRQLHRTTHHGDGVGREI